MKSLKGIGVREGNIEEGHQGPTPEALQGKGLGEDKGSKIG